MNVMQNKLIAEFADAEYAHAYMGSHTVSKLSAQIYWTRKNRGWTQAELAKHAEMAQERISKIEAGDFTSLTMKTLQKLAVALDVNLRIEFEPFSHGILSVCNQSRKSMELPDRATSLDQLKHSLAVIPAPMGLQPILIPQVMDVVATTTGVTDAPRATTVSPSVTQWRGQAEGTT